MVNTLAKHELLHEFSELLSEKTGLYFPHQRWGDLEKKLVPMMRSLNLTDMNECLEWLIENLRQKQKISDIAYHLTIGETYFFRDARTLTALEKVILPEMIHRHHRDKKIRIWSAGCCTGEEPYTLAILLHRLLPDRSQWDIAITGSDINQEYIRKAEQAHYGRWSLRATPQEIRSQYFVEHGRDSYQLISDIRGMVRFFVDNLVAEEGHRSICLENEMDLILCNNVLIYFSHKQIQQTVRRLVKALAPEGWLSVSSIEVPYISHDQLSALNVLGMTFFKKGRVAPESRVSILHEPAKRPPSDQAETILLKVVLPAFLNLEQPVLEYHFSTPEPHELRPKDCVSEPKPALSQADYVALFHQKRYVDLTKELLEVLKPCEKNPHAFKNHLQQVILLIRTYANQGFLLEASEWCKRAIQIDKLDPILRYLYAEIQSGRGEIKEAVKSLKKAIYLDGEFVAAHYLLGLLEPREGMRELQIALTLIRQYDPEDILPGTEELTAGVLKDLILTALSR